MSTRGERVDNLKIKKQMEKYNEFLLNSEKNIRTADHIVYITYPLIKENKLLKKIVEEMYEGTRLLIEAILEYEKLYKRIESSDTKWNLFRKHSQRFGINSQEIEIIRLIMELMEKHKTSSLEFIRKDKLVLMSNNLHTESIDIEKMKRYLNTLKAILQKTKLKIIEETQILKK